jgi:hypothetical protein
VLADPAAVRAMRRAALLLVLASTLVGQALSPTNRAQRGTVPRADYFQLAIAPFCAAYAAALVISLFFGIRRELR